MANRTIHFVSLGLRKEPRRHRGDARRGGARRLARRRRAGRGRGHRRQHVRLHRRGQEGVDRHHLRARGVQAGRGVQEARRHADASRSGTPGELAAQMPEVDHFLGSSDMLKLDKRPRRRRRARMLVGNPADWVVRASDPRVVTQSRASAWLKIAEGCNRTCAFCVIPQPARQAALAHRRRRRRRGGAARGGGGRRAEPRSRRTRSPGVATCASRKAGEPAHPQACARRSCAAWRT